MEAVIDIKEEVQASQVELPVKYNITDAAINQLKVMYFDLEIVDKDTYKEVVAAISDVRKRRTAVEKRRVELKAGALDYGRRVDAEAKRITGLLGEIEEHLKEKRQAEDMKEVRRIEAIRAKINAIKIMVPATPTTSDVLRGIQFDADTMEIGDEFQEFAEEAEDVRKAVSVKLDEIISARLQWESEENVRKEELAKLEALKAGNARIEAERIAREAEAEKVRQAEREKIEIERRALEAERAKLEAEKKEAQERIETVRRARFEMLLKVGFTYPLDDLGSMTEQAFMYMFDEHNKAWEEEQNRIFLENLEKERRERAEFERIAKEKAECEAREKLEREEKERKAKTEAEEAERKRQEALKPDAEKLLAFAAYLENELPITVAPRVSSDQAAAIRLAALNSIFEVVKFIKEKVLEF